MELPKGIRQHVNPTVNNGRKVLQTKTLVYGLSDIDSGKADEEVNTFCQCHETKSIVLDRHTSHFIYRIVYVQLMKD